MEKILLHILSIVLISCSSDDNIGWEPDPIDPKLNLTEATLKSEGDSIEIFSSSDQDLIAVRDTVGQPKEMLGHNVENTYVSDGVRHRFIDMGWYSITQIWTSRTMSSTRLIIKVKPNHTDADRKVPITIFSRRDEHSSAGIYTKTNFVQEKSTQKVK